MLGLLSFTVAAQDNRKDSLTRKLKEDSIFIYRKTIARPYLKAENRSSFLVKERINLYGFLAGVTLYDKHIVSAGYYFLSDKSKGYIKLRDGSGMQQFSKLSYGDFAYQHILLNYRYIQLNVPLEIGYGAYEGNLIDANGNERPVSGNFIPAGLGLQLILKPLTWIGVSGIGGYRYVKHDAIRLSFNGWYYSFGVWLDARLIIRKFRYRAAKKKYNRELLKYK